MTQRKRFVICGFGHSMRKVFFSDRHNPPNSFNSHDRLFFSIWILHTCRMHTGEDKNAKVFLQNKLDCLNSMTGREMMELFFSPTNRQICHVLRNHPKKFPTSLRFIWSWLKLIRWYAPCISIGGLCCKSGPRTGNIRKIFEYHFRWSRGFC